MSRFWTAEQEGVLRARYPHEKTANLVDSLGHTVGQIYKKADVLGLKKTEVYLASPDAQRLRRGDKVGKAHRFAKGHQTWNKGTHFVAGGRSAETRFKKGDKPHTWNPVGSERITREGILERKISDTGITRHDYKPVHVMLWEEANGKVPKGRIVIFKDKNRQNFALENLECISRAENMKRNSYHNYPKEIAQLIQLRGALQRKINKGKNNEQPAN